MDAINDKNVLPFRVDYIKTMDAEPDMDDKQVWDIDREKAFMAPKRISLVTKYILDHFDQKTYRGDKSYEFNLLTNVAEVASAQRGAVDEIKQNSASAVLIRFSAWHLCRWQSCIIRSSKTDGGRSNQAAAHCYHLQLWSQ